MKTDHKPFPKVKGPVIYVAEMPDVMREDIIAFGSTEKEAYDQAKRMYMKLRDGTLTWREAVDYHSFSISQVPVPGGLWPEPCDRQAKTIRDYDNPCVHRYDS